MEITICINASSNYRLSFFQCGVFLTYMFLQCVIITHIDLGGWQHCLNVLPTQILKRIPNFFSSLKNALHRALVS